VHSAARLSRKGRTCMAPPGALKQLPAVLIADLVEDLGVTEQDLAGIVRANVRTVERWRQTGTYPQRAARERLAELEALHQHLRNTFASPEARRAWMHHATPFLGEMTPADALRAGRLDRVEAALEALDSGIAI